uniref:EG45-like domain containing protein 1 n=1 Tax=Nicotiana tabacum TaxID=4097 RepID=A0A1S4CDT8_TOBAC|nr:PREDICTED: putative EG45-like domain containing protein 1 [Nicotiana tabacum]
MSKPLPLLLQWLSLFLIVSQLFYASQADLGTASQYSPPYTPAGEGIWDDGAACGRQYLISCISSILPRACKSGETIQIKIVDRAQTVASKPTRQGTTTGLSSGAFAAIADSNALSLNIDFQQ